MKLPKRTNKYSKKVKIKIVQKIYLKKKKTIIISLAKIDQNYFHLKQDKNKNLKDSMDP